MTLTVSGFRIAWRLCCVWLCWVARQCHVICCPVVCSCTCCVNALLFEWFVCFVTKLQALGVFSCKCDRQNADLFFSVISVFTSSSRVLRLLIQSFLQKTSSKIRPVWSSLRASSIFHLFKLKCLPCLYRFKTYRLWLIYNSEQF